MRDNLLENAAFRANRAIERERTLTYAMYDGMCQATCQALQEGANLNWAKTVIWVLAGLGALQGRPIADYFNPLTEQEN